ncbi:PAS domain S-box protein [bacterium]|nr:PAS domain S-box protein [bacterium]
MTQKKPKILVVEDERIVAEDIKASLCNLGYTVTELVSSGEEALSSIESARPDLVLMDIMLRGSMNGIETAERIQTVCTLPIIYLTAYADGKTLDHAKRTEPFGYILKPFSDKELQSTIEMALYKYNLEAELKRSRTWLSTALNSIADAVITTDENGLVTMLNPAAEELTGWQADQIIGHALKDRFAVREEESGLKIQDLVRDMLTSQEQTRLLSNLVLSRKDGSEVFIEGSAAHLKNERNQVFGLILAFQDITVRRLAEKALRDSEEKFRAITASAQDAIVIIDNQGLISYWNPAAEKIFGYSYEEMYRQQMHPLILADDYIKHVTNGLLEYTISGQPPFISKILELDAIKKDGGDFPVELSLSLLKLKEEWHVLGIIRDISERKRLEEERKKMQDQLFQIQKMEAIGTLAGGIAHDFNNLLTAVCGQVDLAMSKLDESSPIFESFKHVMATCKSAAGLVRQLLLFSHKQPVVLSTLNLNMHIQEILSMIERIIGEDIVINTQFDEDLWSVRADYSNIEQLIMNLAINARDAMVDGGILTIKTDNVVLTDQDCQTKPDTRPGRYVRITVTDNGSGIDEKDLPHIFEPFYTTKPEGMGTGLGLAVVYGIMKKHKGWITVESELDRGSRFELMFPSTSQKDETKHKKIVSASALQGNGTRVLIVEDQENVREFTHTALIENGYQAMEAASVKEALHIFETQNGKFDIIFSDVVLPDKTGISLVEELLSLKPDLKILLSSGYTDERLQWPIIQERGFRFLKKPYMLNELLQALRDIIDQT